MNCELIYDLLKSGYGYWQLTLVFIGVSALCLLWILFRKNVRAWSQRKYPDFTPFLCFGIVATWTVLFFGQTYLEYRDVLEKVRRGEFSLVEGNVENFSPLKYGRGAKEKFRVEGINFEYDPYLFSPGLNIESFTGIGIKNGSYLKISYTDGTIVRLEACQNK